MIENLLWRTDLFDPPLVHDDHAVGHFERFFLIVRHEDAGDDADRYAIAATSDAALAGPWRPGPPKGSSSNNTRGCRSRRFPGQERHAAAGPPESCAGKRSSKPSRRTSANNSSTRALTVPFFQPRTSAGRRATFSKTFKCRNSRIVLKNEADVAVAGGLIRDVVLRGPAPFPGRDIRGQQ